MRRYPGIRSFESSESSLFFGRKREIHELYDMIKARRFVVLFSKSGMGKSSLLQAGVLPRLQQEQYYPIKVRFQDKNTTPEKALRTAIEQHIEMQGLTERVKANLQLFFKTQNYNKENLNFTSSNNTPKLSSLINSVAENLSENSVPTLWEYFKAATLFQGNQDARPLLIFDQFEEFFSHPQNDCLPVVELLRDWLMERVPERVEDIYANTPRKERSEFHNTWVQPLDWKLVIAIRSDKLSYLDALSEDIPIIFNNRYQLLSLQKENATEAILAPAALAGDFDSPVFQYEDAVTSNILTNLSNEKSEIEPFQLQLLCQHLEQQVIDAKLHTITEKEIGGKAGIQEILNNYYERSINTLPQNQQLSARQLIEQGLIIDGARVSLAEAVVKSHYKIDDTLLAALLGTRLIRIENTHLGRAFEVAHDTLVAPITKSFTQRAQKEAAQKRQAVARRTRKRLFVAIALVSVLVTAFVVALSQQQQANNEIARTHRILNNIYFYGNEFGMTAQRDSAGGFLYGFINKQGEKRLNHQYKDAYHFDEYGFARVKRDGNLYLIDTTGKEYLLAESLAELNAETKALSLNEQLLETFPAAQLAQFPQIEILYLRGNRFQKLPNELQKLSTLKVIDVSQNQLTDLPDVFAMLPRLEIFDAHRNNINEVAPLAKATNLHTLILRENAIGIVPVDISALPKLRLLDIYANKTLAGLSAEFWSKKQLTVVIERMKRETTSLGVLAQKEKTNTTLGSNAAPPTPTNTISQNTDNKTTITNNSQNTPSITVSGADNNKVTTTTNNSTTTTTQPNNTTVTQSQNTNPTPTPTPSYKIKMILVEGGDFEVGSNSTAARGTLIRTFTMSETEITQAQYLSVMGENPSSFKGCSNCPVETVSWFNAIEFCNKLSIKEELTPCYTIKGDIVGCNWSANGYRLPTEIEWEYAARGGKKSNGYKYSGSNSFNEVAWHADNRINGKIEPRNVKSLKANELGLYDMSGNVYEWCWDWYLPAIDEDPFKSKGNTIKNTKQLTQRVLRGGAWDRGPAECRVLFRYFNRPSNRTYDYGFRVVRSINH